MDTNDDNVVNCEDDCYSPFYPVSVPMQMMGWQHLAVGTLLWSCLRVRSPV